MRCWHWHWQAAAAAGDDCGGRQTHSGWGSAGAVDTCYRRWTAGVVCRLIRSLKGYSGEGGGGVGVDGVSGWTMW
jgi:hypothetical protein